GRLAALDHQYLRLPPVDRRKVAANVLQRRGTDPPRCDAALPVRYLARPECPASPQPAPASKASAPEVLQSGTAASLPEKSPRCRWASLLSCVLLRRCPLCADPPPPGLPPADHAAR